MSTELPFKQLIWFFLTKGVPAGKVATYKTLSVAATGSSASSRAVGMAMKTNPYAPIVPCHRIIGADLTLHGYSGPADAVSGSRLEFKASLLRSEGVAIALRTGKIAPKYVIETISLPRPTAQELDAFMKGVETDYKAYITTQAQDDVAKAFADKAADTTAPAAKTAAVGAMAD